MEEELAAVDGLTDEQRAHLAALIAQARERQSRELHEAAEQALSMVPRLLRGTVKKLVMG